MKWCDVMWYDVMCDNVMWCDVIWNDMIYDMIWFDMIWCDMMWYDMIWYDLILHTSLQWLEQSISLSLIHKMHRMYFGRIWEKYQLLSGGHLSLPQCVEIHLNVLWRWNSHFSMTSVWRWHLMVLKYFLYMDIDSVSHYKSESSESRCGVT